MVSVVAFDAVAAAAKTREAPPASAATAPWAPRGRRCGRRSRAPPAGSACCAPSRRARRRASRATPRRSQTRRLPERAAFEDALRLTWNASDAWTPALPDVATQAYSSDYGDDGVLTDDDGVAAASRAAEAAAALAALRLRVAPPSTTAALDAATAALTHALPRAREERRAFANVVLEATNVVVVAAGAFGEDREDAGEGASSSGDRCFGDGPPLTRSVADEAVVRLAEASRVVAARRDARARARAERDAAETDAWTREIEEDTPLAILAGARQAGALATAACAELLARTPERAAAAAAASALQAAGTAIARRGGGVRGTAGRRGTRTRSRRREDVPRAARRADAHPRRGSGGFGRRTRWARGGGGARLHAPVALADVQRLRAPALRAVAGAAAGPEITAAAAAAADAADAAASGEDLALAAEARRGAAAAATSAFVDPARPEAASRVEATAEGVFELGARALARVESLDVDEEEGEDEAEAVEKAEKDEEVEKAEKAARKSRAARLGSLGEQRRRRRSLPSPRVRGDASRSPPPPRWRR